MAGTKLLNCVDCGAEFEFLDRDAIFYQEKGWEPPRRCKTCRLKKNPESKLRGAHKHGHDPEGAEAIAAAIAAGKPLKFKANCATCGIETVVNFKPDPNRPIYCRSCLNKVRAAQRS